MKISDDIAEVILNLYILK